MGTIFVPRDFKEFLQLLNSQNVEYLVLGGFAVGYYGYPRATGDIDIWIASSRDNAERVVRVLREFGFSAETVSTDLFLKLQFFRQPGLEGRRFGPWDSLPLEIADVHGTLV